MAIQNERTTSRAPAPQCAYRGAPDRWAALGGVRPDATLPKRDRPGLTALEHQVLCGLAAGLSEREIALRVMRFEPAVRTALRSIVQKLRVRNRAEAVAQAASRREEM